MKNRITLPCILLLLAPLMSSLSLAQSSSQGSSDSSPYPVIYGQKDDGFPEKLKVRGTIEEVSMAGSDCGGIAWAGTLKVKLEGKMEGYGSESVYVLVPCFSDGRGEREYLKKCVDITVTKQYAKGKPCYYDLVANSIDSKGVPFYCLKELGEGKLIEKIECSAAKRKSR